MTNRAERISFTEKTGFREETGKAANSQLFLVSIGWSRARFYWTAREVTRPVFRHGPYVVAWAEEGSPYGGLVMGRDGSAPLSWLKKNCGPGRY